MGIFSLVFFCSFFFFHPHFLASETLRGDMWRGKDCDDGNANIYPGRKQSSYGPNTDHNCNGIFGVNGTSGKSWEEELCSGTEQYGVIILGDSAGAHFHIPPSYLTASLITEETYKDILDIVFMEFDWPQMSATTGFFLLHSFAYQIICLGYETTNWVGHPEGNVSSTYLHMLERNRCSFRDFQSIAVNGARSSAMQSTIMYTLNRNQTIDHPVSLTYALVGNGKKK